MQSMWITGWQLVRSLLFFIWEAGSLFGVKCDMASLHHFSKLYQFCCHYWNLLFHYCIFCLLCCIFVLLCCNFVLLFCNFVCLCCIFFLDGVDLGQFSDHHFIHSHFLLEFQDFVLHRVHFLLLGIQLLLVSIQFLILGIQLLRMHVTLLLPCVLLSLQSVSQLFNEQVLFSLHFEIFLHL